MAFDLPPLKEAAREPEKYIPVVEEMLQTEKDRLRGLSGVLRHLRKIQMSTEELEYIQEHGVPRPRDPEGSASHSDDDEDAEDERPGPQLSRRERVLQLLAQDPDQRWKVRDLASALGIKNVKSLRTSMDEFARAGAVEKDPRDSTYYLGRKGYQESF
ncbi:hypothetical protein [Streptomyces sp. NPDC001404]|uniref:hypothetical protein n=1 Tax=Streptomyces sp. NPDC001404 TaxID=3364571 RepID=UPI0036CCD489